MADPKNAAIYIKKPGLRDRALKKNRPHAQNCPCRHLNIQMYSNVESYLTKKIPALCNRAGKQTDSTDNYR